jgi:predicted phosphohydrolase
MEYQVTIICNTNEYKPVSCIVKMNEAVDLTNRVEKQKVANKGVQKICFSRRWTQKDLKRYNYNRIKVRFYDRETIEQEKKDNYDLIKAIKYTTGEWKKPKGED